MQQLLDESQATLQFTSVMEETTVTLVTAETYAMAVDFTTVNCGMDGRVGMMCLSSGAYAERYGKDHMRSDFSAALESLNVGDLKVDPCGANSADTHVPNGAQMPGSYFLERMVAPNLKETLRNSISMWWPRRCPTSSVRLQV